MIKALTQYDFSKADYFPTDKIRCKTKLKTRWFDVDKTNNFWWWDNPADKTLGPTILTAWSK